MTEYTITREDAERDLRALRSALSGFPAGVSSSVIPALQELADSIEAQVKPVVDEPTAFGSLVSARSFGPLSMLWQRSPDNGKHYWESETGAVAVWSELRDPEVLRVGIGETGNGEDYRDGFSEAKLAMLQQLRILRSGAITAERQNAYGKAIVAVKEIQP